MNWDAAEIRQAAKYWRSGLSGAQIAKQMGVTRGAILGLAHRNRDLFPSAGKKAAPRKPMSGRKPSQWTEEILTAASRSWKAGAGIGEIASAAGATRAAMLGQIHRRRDLFPIRKTKRQPKQRIKSSAPAMPVFEPACPSVQSVNDLSRFQIAGSEPVAFIDLGRRQCRFPLECMEVVSGPQTLCCGAKTEDLASYCVGHRRVMMRAAA